MALETYNILNRFLGEIQCSVEIDCAPDALPNVKLGFAIKVAIAENKNLSGTYLCGANLSGANLSGANLGGANLGGANLCGANLSGANLCGANLGGANLCGANLGGANLSGANLSGANLGGANLRGANLRGAYLSDANLGGANLSDANLGGVYLSDAKIRDGITISLIPIQIFNLVWAVSIYDQHMQIGCEFHSLHEWENFTNFEIIAMDGRAAAKFWKAHKDILLGLARANGRSFEPFTPTVEAA